MDRDTAAALRGGIVRGYVLAVDDTGPVQTIDVETHEGVERAGVEVLQPYGEAGVPPEGGMVLLIAVGGDQGDFVALPVGHPGARLGGLPPGAKGIYDAQNNRVLIINGVVQIASATKVRVTVGGTVLEVSASGVDITGDLRVNGQVSDVSGSMQEMRDRYNTHTGHSSGGPPSPRMD
jgi:phage gp45-like